MCGWDMRNREIFSVFIRSPLVKYCIGHVRHLRNKHAHVITGDAPIVPPVPAQERELMPDRRSYRGRRADLGDTAGTGESTHLNKKSVSKIYAKLDVPMFK